MGESYLTSLPSRVTGSLGVVKQVASLAYGRVKRVWPDEWNKAADFIVNGCKTIGIAGSSDVNSHEYRLDRLEEIYPGFNEEFLHFSAGFSQWIDGVAVGYTVSFLGNAVGAAIIPLQAAAETGYTSEAVFRLQSSKFDTRFYSAGLPGTAGDFLRVGLYANANNYVMFESIRAGAWPVWTVEIVSGGVSQASDVLIAVPQATTFHTFEIETTATGAVFTYDRGEGTEEEVTLIGVPAAGAAAMAYETAQSNVGGENLVSDYIRCHDTNAFGMV